MPAHSIAIANEFIELAALEDRQLTQMQLQKLVYIANGWTLAIFGDELTSDPIRAWKFGPVYPELYSVTRKYGAEPLHRKIRYADAQQLLFGWDDDKPVSEHLSQEERRVVKRTYEKYGHFKGFQLSALTHAKGTPWTEIYRAGQGEGEELPSDLIREHFIDLARA